MVFAGAGAVTQDQLVSLADKSFNKLPTGSQTNETSGSREHKFTGSDARFNDVTMDEIHYALAFESVGWTHPDSVAFMVMQSLLGQWDPTTPAGSTPTAQFCKEVVGEKACKSVMAFNTTYSNTGLFGVYGVAEHTEVENLLYIQMNEMVRMCHKLSDWEVNRAKNQLKTTMAMQLGDGTSAICEDIGRQVLTYGRRVPVEEMFARIDAVDADTIKRVATDHIHDQDIAFVSFGPRDDGKAKPRRVIPDYNWLRRRTYWLRY
jgi:processing peptidase subunit beta